MSDSPADATGSAPMSVRPIAVIGGTGPAGMGLALRWVRPGTAHHLSRSTMGVRGTSKRPKVVGV